MIGGIFVEGLIYGIMVLGEIIFEADGGEKKALTVEKLIDKFHQICHKSFENDRTLLSDE